MATNMGSSMLISISNSWCITIQLLDMMDSGHQYGLIMLNNIFDLHLLIIKNYTFINVLLIMI